MSTEQPGGPDANPEQPPPSWRSGVLPSNVASGPVAGTGTPTWRAVQSPWLVAALVLASFNLYVLWWLGRTWWQLKQEDGDTKKRPVWHALAMLVPIYGYFRFHAHIRTIAQVAATPDARQALSPGTMTVAWIVINILSGVAIRPDVPAWLLVLASVLCAALFGWAQAGLNVVWRSLPGGTTTARVHPVHWLILVFGFTLWTLAALGGALQEPA